MAESYNPLLQALLRLFGKKILTEGLNYGWNQLGPLIEPGAGSMVGGEAGKTLGSLGSDAGVSSYQPSEMTAGLGEGVASEGMAAGAGEAGASLGAGGYASLAAPLIMAWMKYSAGSGRNYPVEQKNEIDRGIFDFARLMKNPNLQANQLYSGMTGQDGNPISFQDIYHGIHDRGTGSYMTESGKSGVTDAQIDQKLLGATGLKQSQLSQLMGYDVPDFSQPNSIRYVDWWKNQMDKLNQEAMKSGWGGTTTGSKIDEFGNPSIDPETQKYEDFRKNWDFWAGKPKTGQLNEVLSTMGR
jgi:hypothetical protein